MKILDMAMRVAIRLQSEGKPEEAKIILKSLLEICPTHGEALHLSGIIAYQAGNTDSGIALIQQAIQSNPAVALFHSNLGEMHRQLKSIHASIQCGQRAVALDPHSAPALSNLGIAYYDAEQYDQAEDCHKRALAIYPKLVCSLNNMGSIHKACGKIQQAVAHYKAAIAASPQSIEPLNNLGTLYLEKREFRQAIEYFSRAALLAPSFPEAHCNRGLASLGLDQYDEAWLHFEKALQLKSDYAEACYGISKIYLYKNNFIESEHYIHKAITSKPQQVEFYQLLADIFREQGDPAQALKYLDHALSLDSTLASTYLNKGSVLMEMGEISKAAEQFSEIAEDPLTDTRVLAHYSLIQLQKTKPDNPSLKALLSIARNIHEVSPDKQEYVHFALGKCHDDMGEWTKAFASFRKGCTLKRRRITYDIGEQVEYIQKIKQYFTMETIEHLQEFANPSKLPLFIVGMPRSGSTLVEQILSSLPHVYGAGELTCFNDLIRSPVETHKTKLHYPENILHYSKSACESITVRYLSFLQRISPNATHIIDKMPYNFIAIGLIHALFPNAKIIHVRRNPMDTCLSCYTKLFSRGQLYSYDLTELGQYYNCYKSLMAHWRRILPVHAWLEVDYEAIVEDIETEAKRLTAWCNLPWDPACLAFYQSKRQVRTASFMQVREPLYASSVNRWHRFENELAPLVEILGQIGNRQ